MPTLRLRSGKMFDNVLEFFNNAGWILEPREVNVLSFFRIKVVANAYCSLSLAYFYLWYLHQKLYHRYSSTEVSH